LANPQTPLPDSQFSMRKDTTAPLGFIEYFAKIVA